MQDFSSHPLYRKHDIDSVMSSMWGFYKSKFLVLFLASVVVATVMQFITMSMDLTSLQNTTDPEVMLEKLMGMIRPILLASLVNIVFTVIMTYYILLSPVDGSVTILTACYKALKVLIPYLIIMVLFTFFASMAAIIGIVALIIGIFFTMLYVMVLYMFILPLLIVEGTSIANVISRTFRLAHNGFWQNMGWVAVFVIILLVISVFASFIIMIPFTGQFFKILSNPQDVSGAMDYLKNPWYIGLSVLVSALYTPLMPIFSSIMYFNGRAKEDMPEARPVISNEPERVRVEDLYAKPREENQFDKAD